jgi:hypothetical protein
MATIQVTLNIENEAAERVNQYAARQHTNITNLLESYLKGLAETEDIKENTTKVTKPKKELKDYPEWLQEIVLSKEPTEDFDHKAEYGKHIEEKYGS